ncbi:MAG: thioredoxin [Candidatus Moranbacteria bacterium]|nr:thioredoxin [Candidatus Moranbacteria bacterium]
MELNLNDKNFDQEVIKSDKPVLVDFWAPWCGPCQVMGPIVEELAKEFEGKVKIGKMNVDENPETSQKYDIMSIPSLKIFKGGKIVKEFTGVQSKEILKEELSKI